MSEAPNYDHFGDDCDECWECNGDGGWNSCMEDTCCAIGGEEGCDDPICWRRCPICKGKGFLPLHADHEGGDGR